MKNLSTLVLAGIALMASAGCCCLGGGGGYGAYYPPAGGGCSDGSCGYGAAPGAFPQANYASPYGPAQAAIPGTINGGPVAFGQPIYTVAPTATAYLPTQSLPTY